MAQRGFVQARFACHHQQGNFGRVAGVLPAPAFEGQRGIVAQGAGNQGFTQGRAGLAAAQDANRYIAVSVNRDNRAAGPQFGHGHRVFGQRAGLVGADHRGAAQGFHGRQVADDGAALGHAADADGQGNAHGSRQALRDGADGQRHGRDQHGRHRFATPDPDDEGQRSQAKNHPEQQSGKFAHLLRQRRGDFGCAGDQAGNAAGFGGVRRGDDQAVALAGNHAGAGIGHVAAVGKLGVVRQLGVVLVDRCRFAGQRRLNGAQSFAGNDAQVGRYLVAGAEPDHIARYQMHRVHAPPPAGAKHRDIGCHRARQCCQRGFGLAFLQVADDRVHDDHAENDRGVDPFAKNRSGDSGADQYQHQGFLELPQETAQRAAPGLFAQAVRAVAQQACRGFFFSETLTRIHAVPGQGFIRSKAVPGRVGRCCAWRRWCRHGPIVF